MRKPRRLLFEAECHRDFVECSMFDDTIAIEVASRENELGYRYSELNLKEAKNLNAWLTRAIKHLEGKDD